MAGQQHMVFIRRYEEFSSFSLSETHLQENVHENVGRESSIPARVGYLIRVVSVWFGLPNMNGVQPDSLERWSVQVERNMSKAVLVPRNT